MTRPTRYNLVLSIYLTAHGFTFTLFEGMLAHDRGLRPHDRNGA
jgi:hypothetical protein